MKQSPFLALEKDLQDAIDVFLNSANVVPMHDRVLSTLLVMKKVEHSLISRYYAERDKESVTG